MEDIGIFGRRNDEQRDNKDESEKLEANRVIVRVWLPKVAKKSTSVFKAIPAIASGAEANVGHVSIETSNTYASFWPEGSIDGPTGMFKMYKAYHATLAEDEKNEDGPADLLVCLYSLNLNNIDDAFDEVKQTEVGYVFVGESYIAEKGQSCCSLAYHLLREGGINRLNASKSSVMASMFITPDNFAEFIRNVKLLELEKYPETKGIVLLEGEYIPAQKDSCLIM